MRASPSPPLRVRHRCWRVSAGPAAHCACRARGGCSTHCRSGRCSRYCSSPSAWPICCRPSAAETSPTCAPCRAPACKNAAAASCCAHSTARMATRPDPQRWFDPPERFALPLELMHRADDAAQLVFAFQRLVQALAGWLSRQWLAASRLRLHLRHERGRHTEPDENLLIELGAALARRGADHGAAARTPATPHAGRAGLRHRAAARRSRVVGRPRGPVAARPRTAGAGIPGADRSPRVAPRRRSRAAACAARRSSARAGQRRGRGAGASGSRSRPASGMQLRPVWLLPEPLRLAERDGVPVHGSPLALLSRAERVEAGWFDGELVCRDYHVAEGADHRLRWIYRARCASRRRDGVVPARLVRLSRSRGGDACRSSARKDQSGAAGGRCPAAAPTTVAGIRRAALPLELQLPHRRIASRRTGAPGTEARLPRTRNHRRMLGRGRGARAHRNEELAAAGARRFRFIVGSEFDVQGAGDTPGCRLVLLARNREGYGNLCELITVARLRSRKGEYRVDVRDIDAPQAEFMHLRAMPDCFALLIPRRSDPPAAAARAGALDEIHLRRARAHRRRAADVGRRRRADRAAARASRRPPACRWWPPATC